MVHTPDKVPSSQLILGSYPIVKNNHHEPDSSLLSSTMTITISSLLLGLNILLLALVWNVDAFHTHLVTTQWLLKSDVSDDPVIVVIDTHTSSRPHSTSTQLRCSWLNSQLLSTKNNDESDNRDCTVRDDVSLLLSIKETAKIQLTWEKIQSVNEKPVLNLSMRDVSPDQKGATASRASSTSDGDWEDGQKWKKTFNGLTTDHNVCVDDELSFLQNCPQLYRLDTSLILEAAQWLRQEFGEEYLCMISNNNSKAISSRIDPRILSYKVDDLAYGLEYLGLMMMMPNTPDIVKSMCIKSSDLFIQAVEGGIQERAVQSALGEASKATSQATQNVASEAISSFRQLQDSRRHKK